uniref:BZIP domain-containing protein n=1 Tax=Pelusios castaneus TaxID=367368 RepID=A0A8C8S081_9SAUR
MNRTLKSHLAKLCQETHLDWVTTLPVALLRIRCAPLKSTGISPYKILYGKPPPIVSSVTPDLVQLGDQLTRQQLDISRATIQEVTRVGAGSAGIIWVRCYMFPQTYWEKGAGKDPRFGPDDCYTWNNYIPDEELIAMSAKELSQQLQGINRDEALWLRRRRRTLKNKGYAQISRFRKVQQRTALELEKDQLVQQVKLLKQKIARLTREKNAYKQKYEKLRKSRL